MALWTPYVQDSALDLSFAIVKQERDTLELPVPETSTPPPPVYSVYPYVNYELSQPHVSPVDSQTEYYGYVDHRDHQPASVPSAQISPQSDESAVMWSEHTYRRRVSSASTSSPPQSPKLYDTESLDDDIEFQIFERDAMRALAEKNGGSLLGNNPRMRRAVQTYQTADDDSYRKQRERNNFAAKQSRDRRKVREVRLAFQVTFLKKKMADLKARLTAGMCGRCDLGMAGGGMVRLCPP